MQLRSRSARPLAALGLAVAALGVASIPVTASADEVSLVATLTPGGETGGGLAGASGQFSATLDTADRDLCYTLTVAKLPNATMAHIHAGAAGSDGDPVVPVAVTGKDGEECVAVSTKVLEAIVADPSAYYVNVHSPAFPKGAIRGQLSAK